MLLKAFIARWCPDNNSAVICFEELVMFLWDSYCITWLPIVEEMHDELLSLKKIIMSKKLSILRNAYSKYRDGCILKSSNPSLLGGCRLS